MRNPSWCTPEQSLHHLCKQSTYCFFQELIRSGVSGCQAYTLRAKVVQRKEERWQRKREPKKHWLTPSPSKLRTSPRHFHFAFSKTSFSLAPSTGMAWPAPNHQVRGSSWHSSYFFLKVWGWGTELPRKYSPLLFYSLIFEDHTVPFPLSLLLAAFDLNIGIPTLSSSRCPWH